MARVTVEDCLDRVNSRFALVHLAVRRVLQMRSGGPALVDAPKNKEVVVALREIAAGYVSVDNIRELEPGAKAQEAFLEVESPEPVVSEEQQEPDLDLETAAVAEGASDIEELSEADENAGEDGDAEPGPDEDPQ